MKLLKGIVTILCALSAVLPALAVSDQDMEQARVITAKAYLRWANNGSGYLDELNVSSMAQLEAKLKKVEIDNLKAFKSVSVPTDYASWDKAKLVEFWSVKFFDSPALSADGKRAKSTVKKRIEAMTVSAPSAAQAPAPVQATEAKSETPEAKPAPDNNAAMDSLAESFLNDQENILADQEAIAADKEAMAEEFQPEDSHTWIYVVILVILVGVVIWLVVFAANTMKRSGGIIGGNSVQGSDGNSGEKSASPVAETAMASAVADAEDKIRARFAASLAKKNEELANANRRIQILEDDNAALRKEKEMLESKLSEVSSALQIKPQPRQKADIAPGRNSSAPAAGNILKVIYLGRVNSRGMFIRADRKISIGNTVYRLDTNDGLVGTFRIAEDPTVEEMILMDPQDMLSGGCNVDLSDAENASRFVTDSSGTAIFENGCWKVLRKCSVHFE